MKRAFSLIELLVVIALVGILSAVVIASIPDGAPRIDSPSVADAVNVIPDATNYAVDTSGVLNSDQLAALNTKLKSIADSGKEIAVLLVKTTSPMSIEEYGIRLGEKWRVGKTGKDNGVILIVATEDRKIRIEVGSGAEADITDSAAGSIIRDVIAPKLKSGDWLGGVNDGVDAINAKLN